MFWGNLCLGAFLKRNERNINIGQVSDSLSKLSWDIPKLFAVIPLAGDSDGCRKSHFFLHHSGDGAGSFKQLQIGQEQTVELKNEVNNKVKINIVCLVIPFNFQIIGITWIDVKKDWSQTSKVTRYTTGGRLGKARVTLKCAGKKTHRE